MWIDFGDLGTLQSSAEITDRYAAEAPVRRQVVAVTAFDPVRVGGLCSDVLVLGALDPDRVVLIAPDAEVPVGSRIAQGLR